MTLRIYQSFDYDAPELDNVAGNLIDVLDACLVNGYGDQLVTLTLLNNTVTMVFPNPHGIAQYSIYDVSGAVETEYNGTFPVNVVNAFTLEYDIIGTPTSPATGTITAGHNGSGWTKEYSETNKASYKSARPNFYLSINDTTTTYAIIRGYDSMSGVDIGVNPFPTTSQTSIGRYISKSNSQPSPWLIVANDETFIIWVQAENSIGAHDWAHISYIGRYKSYIANNDFDNIIVAGDTTNTNSGNKFFDVDTITTAHGIYTQADYTGVQSSTDCGKHTTLTLGDNIGSGLLSFPHRPDGKLYTHPIIIAQANQSEDIGELFGMLAPLHKKPFPNNSIMSGSLDLAGKVYITPTIYSNSQVMVEISDTWGV